MDVLFQKKNETDKRTGVVPPMKFKVTKGEREQIERDARARAMPVSEFLRRCALHRRAEVQIELDMILALNQAVTSLRDLHADYLAQGIAPPESLLQPLLIDCERAIIALSVY